MAVVNIGKPLRDKLGDDGVDSLIDVINQSQQEQKNGILQIVEEKFERRLSEEAGKLEKRITEAKAELTVLISETKAELMTLISDIKSELKTDNASTKAELIKWMFIFWVGQVAVMLGVLFTFFKK